MGVTGAGGALVAIPLFMHFLEMSLKEASVYSLVAVVIASLSNFFYQRKNANIKLAALFVVASAVGSFLSQPYKNILPEIGIALLLAFIAIFSLYNVWVKKKRVESSDKTIPAYPKTIFIGLILGILTTFTGLGGGVLMLPVLLGMYHLPQKEAVATSLVVIGFSSLASFLIQTSKGVSFSLDFKFLALVAGILITSYTLKWLTLKMDPKKTDLLGKVVFTLVVFISLTKLFS